MNKEIDYKSLAELTFKSLCKVLKKRKMYHHFRCFIGYNKDRWDDDKYMIANDLVGAVYYVLNPSKKYRVAWFSFRRRNPFIFVTTKEELCQTLANMYHFNCWDKLEIKDANKVQTCITQFVNTILHCTIEHLFSDLKQLEDIGREVFETTCKEIYGNDFVDETEKDFPGTLKDLIENSHFYTNDYVSSLMEMSKNTSYSTDGSWRMLGLFRDANAYTNLSDTEWDSHVYIDNVSLF